MFLSFLKKSSIYILFLLFLTILYFFLYKIYMPKVNAFGCFDDCFNFGAGYFLNQGKVLYSEIFFNHQPIPAFISQFIQNFIKPINIFDLVLKHRQALFLFSFLFNALLIIRFKHVGLLFAVVYELTKFYVFGDRFLAEGFIVYPIVYVMGLIFLREKGGKLYFFDYLVAAAGTWFAVFSRLPYIPVSLLLFAYLLKNGDGKKRFISISVFAILSIFLVLQFSLNEYYFNVVTINQQTILKSEAEIGESLFLRIIKTVFYPLHIFISGEHTFFRTVLMFLSAAFILGITANVKKKKWFLLVLIVILAFANTRPTEPGRTFYEAFHMIPWYGLMIFSTVFLVFSVRSKLTAIGVVLLLAMPIYLVSSSKSYLYDNISPHEEFMTNYGPLQESGTVIKQLSDPSNTLFVDGFDELIHWQADRPIVYKYIWYTSVMPAITRYTAAREEMFKNYPPDFYYGSCLGEGNEFRIIPEFAKEKYVNLLKNGNPSCIFVNSSIIDLISEEKWKMVEESGYERTNIKN